MPQETPSPALMRDVPRGKSWEYVRTQSPPQARWQDPEAIRGAAALDYDPARPNGKVLIGAMDDRLIGIADDRHIQTVAGNRAGKSATVIANLFFYDGSVIAVDPKGELASTTALCRSRLGQDVAILDPFRIVSGEAARFRVRLNPLAVVRTGNPFNVEDAVLISDGIVVAHPQQKDPHWDESATQMLIGLILATALGPSTPDAARTLPTVRAMVVQALARETDGESYVLPRRLLSDADAIERGGDPDAAQAIRGAVSSFYEKPPNEMAGVLSTLRRHTQFLDFRAMKDVLGGHDVDLADLKLKPQGQTIYLCLPAMRMHMCNRWLRLIVNQLLEAMERAPRRDGPPVLAVLDEFPVLGHMKQLENAAGQIASFGVKLWTILQDWGQGKAIYGQRFESFAANAGVSQFFANVDLATAEYVSRRLGKTLVTGLRKNDTGLSQRDQGMSGRSEGLDLHDMLTPDEVARLFARGDPLKRQLILWAGLNPMILQRVQWWEDGGPLARHLAAPRSGERGGSTWR